MKARKVKQALLPKGSPFGDPGSHGDLFQILGPKRFPFFSRSPFSIKAEERAKGQSSHYLLNVDNLQFSKIAFWVPICAGKGPH